MPGSAPILWLVLAPHLIVFDEASKSLTILDDGLIEFGCLAD